MTIIRLRLGPDALERLSAAARVVRTFGCSMADAERGAREFRHALQRLDRIHNVRVRIALLKRQVARMGDAEQAALERDYGAKGGVMGEPQFPGWCYTASVVWVLAVIVAGGGFLAWQLFTAGA